MVSVVRETRRALRGVWAAVRARKGIFLAVTLGMFFLSVFLPVLVLSLVRKPWTYFAFNAWLPNLPDFLTSSEVPLQRKLEFLPRLALFWFNADGPYGSVEWGYAVDVSDVARVLVTSLLFGAYFALWAYGGKAPGCAWRSAAGAQGGIGGGVASMLGLSTGPCSVVGCGAPVLPAIGLAFAGLSSGTIRLLSGIARVSGPLVLIAMTAAVAHLGWRVGAAAPQPCQSSSA